MKQTLRQYILFPASAILYLVLHEVVYGLLGFAFFWDMFFIQILYSVFVFSIVWIIRKKLHKYLERGQSWNENPLKRLMVQSLLYASITGLIISTIKIISAKVELSLGANVFLSLQSMVIDFTILAVVLETQVLLEFGQYLLQKWNSARIEMATFQKEKAQFSLELLRTQINPHFLFNNLNTLSSLIYSDQDKAAAFLRKLSGVYRSILEYRNKETISIEEELLFFNQYKELLEIRFENMLFFSLEIDEVMYTKQTIPLTLQMLVENAIKHNVLSQQKPLFVSIISSNGYLLIENNYQPKEALEYSSGLGLKMIESRFSYLAKQPVIIEKTSDHFLVKIPLID